MSEHEGRLQSIPGGRGGLVIGIHKPEGGIGTLKW